ncbi:MAG: GAF domain-containing sensor histidine kinase [Nitrospirae bacterium]|nr:GAF domain-containing sensor histidine kinase [Magnetococcales bacterium]HAT51294.1 hypothetical protein [Alphaproteobacteria bacterium]
MVTPNAHLPDHDGGISDGTITVQQANVIIIRLLQLSLEPLTLAEYLDEVIYVLTATPWLPIRNMGAIFLWHEQDQHLKLAAHVNLTPEHLALCHTIRLGQCHCGQAALSRQMIVTDGLNAQHVIPQQALGEHRDCCIPLGTEEQIWGVLNLYPLPNHHFNEQEFTFLRAISSTLTSAIIRFDQELRLKEAASKAEEDARQIAKQNEELLAADRLRAAVEHISRHDLKTPLTGIISFADMLLERQDLDDDLRKGLEIILNSGYRSLHMINLSLYLFQMEQGTYQLNAEMIDLIPVINNIFRELAQQINKMKIIVNITLNGRPVEKRDRFLFLGEELLAYSMMANLIKNAVEASQAGMAITVALSSTLSHACIQINNAQPVAPQIKETFFQKFITHGKKYGTGLGTFSAKLIAETLKGSITMSSSQTAGTTITILLPLPQRPRQE